MTKINKVLLTGASGFIGRHLNRMLEQEGYQVVPVSRKTGVDFRRMTTVGSWTPHLNGVDAVINAVGIIVETSEQKFDILHRQAPGALFQACSKMGIRRVVQISALGVDDNAFTPYQLTKKAADDVLRSLDLDWFVLRPSLVYGKGGASMRMFQRLSMLPVIPLVGDGLYRVQPVHISDLVATVRQCLYAQQTQRTFDVVGAAPLSFEAWLQAFRINRQLPPAKTVSVPFGLMLALARLGRFFMPILHPDNLRMLRQGNVADVQPLAEFLGRVPLSVEEGLCRI